MYRNSRARPRLKWPFRTHLGLAGPMPALFFGRLHEIHTTTQNATSQNDPFTNRRADDLPMSDTPTITSHSLVDSLKPNGQLNRAIGWALIAGLFAAASWFDPL